MSREKNGERRQIETTFLAIPSPVAQIATLSASSKILFGCIYSLSMTNHGCFSSNDSLARRCGISVWQVKRSLGELEEFRLIRRRVKGMANVRSEIVVTFKGKPIRRPEGEDSDAPKGGDSHEPHKSET